MLYNNLKKFIKKIPTLWKFLRWIKDNLIKLSRLKDVAMMMIMFQVWPEQTYRFSTRRHLPCKKNRFSKESKQTIPYDLLKSKCSSIPIMDEINIVGLGSSFDLNNLKEFKEPTFLMTFWKPLTMDNNEKVIYEHVFSYKLGKHHAGVKEAANFEKYFDDRKNKQFKKNNLIYVNPRESAIKNLKKNGCNVLSIIIYLTNKDGKLYPAKKDWETSSYLNLFDDDQCRRITLHEKIYQPPLLAPYLPWAPTKSLLAGLCALSFFAKKINVYGWDYYLDSSPENMSYWQAFFNMYKYKFDASRGQDHFESALINYYYGYQLSKLPNIKIHGYMGKLAKHHKLAQRIERILFN